MKTSSLLAITIAILFALTACHDTATTTTSPLLVRGDMTNTGDTLVAITLENQNNPEEIVVKNGKFEHNLNVSTPTPMIIASPAVLRQQPGALIQIIAMPGDTLVLSGDAMGKFSMGGSKFYKQYDEVVRVLSGSTQPDTLQQQCLDFIKSHSDYEACVEMVGVLSSISTEKMKEAVALLSPEVKNGRMKTLIDEIVKTAENNEQAMPGTLAEGSEAPDFTLTDINGSQQSLKALRGKVVVIDFWGSWCGWCIKGFPKMKEYYEKYKGKMEILGVDCNDSQEAWRKAVTDNALPWLHVYCPKESPLLGQYQIQGFPTKVIVSAEGKIIRTVIGEDPQFYTFLDELLK